MRSVGVREYGECAVYGLFIQLSPSFLRGCRADATKAEVTAEGDAPAAAVTVGTRFGRSAVAQRRPRSLTA
ncbi:hypothetical protein MPSYJ_48970 [Mycolicibacterium psychrotolerans]|uniref:Uncharacterized protein n=1 Tax=Mycolicibacterium psychrotolerans TaxID=216929 RepID=A0A7I7MH52_9MYCO|nr:hypothetical protein MPSYJ_48970 [Mycolicibacterium psychrotolerans]